jgi:CxxC-x17-CxxC domain-containing protein
MDFKNFETKGDFPQRKKYQGNWKCSECEVEITELPFEPDTSGERPLYCKDCLAKKRAQRPQRPRY